MTGKILSAFWVPGLPHVLSPERSGKWSNLAKGFTQVGKRVSDLRPDTLVVYSTQWLSVLGTSVQVRPQLSGTHVDDNWHDWGDFDYDLKTDTELGLKFAETLNRRGFPTKAVDFEAFPIDTGTLVANRFLNPEGQIPISVVSSWAYADAEKSRAIGCHLSEVIRESGKKVVVVASSLLSTRFFTTEIDPAEDQVSEGGDDWANRSFLSSLESSSPAEWDELAEKLKRQVPTDMQFNAFFWLTGILSNLNPSARFYAYGPQWGSGAAIFEMIPKESL